MSSTAAAAMTSSFSSHQYYLGINQIHGRPDHHRSSSSSSFHVFGLSRLPCCRMINNIPSSTTANKHGYIFSSANQRLMKYSFSTTLNLIRLHQKPNTNMALNAIENLQPGGPLIPSCPPPEPHDGWYNWLVLTIIPMFLPFFKNKWGPLFTIKKEVDMAMDAVDIAAEVVEEMAKKVERIADKVGDNLPEGKLRDAFCVAEHVAEEVIKGADLVEDLIHKAEELEEKLENFIDHPVGDQDKKAAS
ncbi:hypothetical protein BVC80_551g28 [Macleaya cordata]|uniref:Uncharacterized protein n=1 Tax=Macleaya cordata TaxID=56857 RepID=A0A200QE86_MACCD|nr:hypothetical protein BVC80_551g28 [Macleaya cordata]